MYKKRGCTKCPTEQCILVNTGKFTKEQITSISDVLNSEYRCNNSDINIDSTLELAINYCVTRFAIKFGAMLNDGDPDFDREQFDKDCFDMTN